MKNTEVENYINVSINFDTYTEDDDFESAYFHIHDVACILKTTSLKDKFKIISINKISMDENVLQNANIGDMDDNYYEIIRKTLKRFIIENGNDEERPTIILFRINTDYKFQSVFDSEYRFYNYLTCMIHAIEGIGFRSIQSICNFKNSVPFVFRSDESSPIITRAIAEETFGYEKAKKAFLNYIN